MKEYLKMTAVASLAGLTTADLRRRTLNLLADGVCTSAAMRQRIGREHGFDPAGQGWGRFVNNHAWALVQLQAESLIEKEDTGRYRITPSGRAARVNPDPKVGVPLDPIDDAAELPAWAEKMRQAKNQINRLRWPELDARLSPADIRDLWAECRGRCSITGIAFSNDQYGQGAARRAFAPSLDRIDPKGPYTRDNCRFVLVAANFALNAFGDEVFDRLVLARHRRIPNPVAKRLARIE